MPHSTVTPEQRAKAKRLRSAMTDAERRMWSQLRAHRLMGLGFRRQVPIGGYVADFACAAHRLVVEVDGTHHAEGDMPVRDKRRTLALGETGWTVIRFWNHEVMEDLDGVCEHIVAAVAERTPDAFGAR